MRDSRSPARHPISGHLLFVLLMLAFTVWYLTDAFMASRAATNLILILPVGVALTILCLAMVALELRALFRPSSAAGTDARVSGSSSEQLVKWIYAGSMAVFLVLIRQIGVELAAFLFMVADMRLLGAKSWTFTIVYSAAFSLILSYLFVSLMNLRLPSLIFGHL